MKINPLDHQRLVWSIAKRYAHCGMELDDVFQEGFLGLMRATELFDETRGIQFSTYATRWIVSKIVDALRQKTRLVRVPRHTWYSNVTPKCKEAAERMLETTFCRDLDGTRLADLVVDPHPPVDLEPDLDRQTVRSLLDELSDRERYVIELRYGLTGLEPQTLQQVGDRLGCSRENVRCITDKAFSRLRTAARRLESAPAAGCPAA